MPTPPAHETSVDVRAIARRAGFFAIVAVAAIALIAALPGVGEIRGRLSAAEPVWIVAVAVCALMSMFGFVRALWSVFDRVMPWRRAVVLGFAEQGANVLLPAGGTGGPAFGAFVLTRLGVPAELAAGRHAALFLITSAVSFVALVLAGGLTADGLLPRGAPLPATPRPPGRGAPPVWARARGARPRPPPRRPPPAAR